MLKNEFEQDHLAPAQQRPVKDKWRSDLTSIKS